MNQRELIAPRREPGDDLPASLEAEQALIGGVIRHPEILDSMPLEIRPEDFHEQVHTRIFAEILKLQAAGTDINISTLHAALVDIPQITPTIRMSDYLVRLWSEAMPIRGTLGAAEAVIELSCRRTSMTVARSLVYDLSALRPDETSVEKIRSTSEALTMLAARIDGKAPLQTMSDAIDSAIREGAERASASGNTGLDPGIPEIRELTGRWHEKQLIVIPGGPKQAKSALAGQIAEHLVTQAPGYIYSGEMPKEDWGRRALARKTGIPTTRQNDGDMSEQQIDDLVRAQYQIQDLMKGIVIDDRIMTMDALRSRLRDLVRTRGIKWAIVDHAGKILWKGRRADDKEHEQMQEAASRLKDVAQELDITIILICHLKRVFGDPPGRSLADRIRFVMSKFPTYHDVPGSIDKQVDHMIIPFHPNPIVGGLEPAETDPEYKAWEAYMQETEGQCSLILAMSRHAKFPRRKSLKFDGDRMNYYSKVPAGYTALTDGRLL